MAEKLTKSVVDGKFERHYLTFRQSNNNELDSNLTELNASETVDSGFINHTDWMGHIRRYAYIMKQLPSVMRETANYTGIHNDHVLDVGCGQLQLAHFLWKNRLPLPPSFKYFGMELRDIKQAYYASRLKGYMTIFQMDVVLDNPGKAKYWPGDKDPNSPTFGHAQFPMVVCTEVFEHVPRTHAPILMQRLFDWTAPGGYLYFSTPNLGVSDSVAENHLDPKTGEPREWTYEDKIAVAQSVGYELANSYGAFARKDRIWPELIKAGKVSADGKEVLDPVIKAMREFLNPSDFMSVVCAAYPEQSNNAIMRFRKPR